MTASNDSKKKVTVDTFDYNVINGDEVYINNSGDTKHVARKHLKNSFKKGTENIKTSAEKSNELTPEQQQQLIATMLAKQAA